MRNRIFANLACFITAMIWGLSFVAQRAGMEFIGPFTFNMVRSFLGALSLLPLIFWIKYSKPDTRTRRRKKFQRINLARAGIACGLSLFIAMTVQQYCMQFVGAGKAGFISALYIIFVPLIAVLNGEKFKKNIIVSVVLSVIGLYLLCFRPETGIDRYDLLLLVSSFFYGVQILVVNYYSERINPVKACAAQFFVVGVLSAFLVMLFEHPTWQTIIDCRVPIFYAGVLTCGVAYTLQMFGQKHTLPVVASLIFCLESVFAVIGGVLILHETMVPKEIWGCVFMITAVVLSNLDFDDLAIKIKKKES